MIELPPELDQKNKNPIVWSESLGDHKTDYGVKIAPEFHKTSFAISDLYKDFNMPYFELKSKLDSFRELQKNWNGNDAERIQENLIVKADNFLTSTLKISQSLSIFPTARDSIQIEFEKTNGEYCEVEIFSNSFEIYYEKDHHSSESYCYNDLITASDKFLELYDS